MEEGGPKWDDFGPIVSDSELEDLSNLIANSCEPGRGAADHQQMQPILPPSPARAQQQDAPAAAVAGAEGVPEPELQATLAIHQPDPLPASVLGVATGGVHAPSASVLGVGATAWIQQQASVLGIGATARVQQQASVLGVGATAGVQQQAASAPMIGLEEQPGATTLALQQLQPYNERLIESMVAGKRWSELQSYLSNYIPVMEGKDVAMEHAAVFLLCRKAQLLSYLNAPNADPRQALAFLQYYIFPLGEAKSDFVNQERLVEEISYIIDSLGDKRELDINVVVEPLKDYMRFYCPDVIGFHQGRLQSPAWRFMFRLDEGSSKGVVLARCLLCHKVMPKQSNIRAIVVDHIGRAHCKYLTPFAIQVYNSTILERTLTTHGIQTHKRAEFVRPPNEKSGREKALRVDTLLNSGGAKGDNELKDIGKDIDDVAALVADLCLISSMEGKASIQSKIKEVLGGIKTKVTRFAESTEAYRQRMFPAMKNSENAADISLFEALPPSQPPYAAPNFSAGVAPQVLGDDEALHSNSENAAQGNLFEALAPSQSPYGAFNFPAGVAPQVLVDDEALHSNSENAAQGNPFEALAPSQSPYGAFNFSAGVASQTLIRADIVLDNEAVLGLPSGSGTISESADLIAQFWMPAPTEEDNDADDTVGGSSDDRT